MTCNCSIGARIQTNQMKQNIEFQVKARKEYRKVASSNMSHIKEHAGWQVS